MMSNGAGVADADRLPWLEPHREPARARARPARRSSAKPLAIAGIVGLFAAAGAGGYLFGRSGTPLPVIESAAVPPAPQPSATATVPLPEPAPLVIPARPPEAEPNAAPLVEPAARTERRPTARPTRKKVRRYRPARKIRSAGIENASLDEVRASQESPVQSAPAITAPPRVWPKLPSPGPAGQVIQLGAFTHPDRAYSAYRARVSRYPDLAQMPRVIVPVVPKRNGKMYYVLRLGTKSRNQSKSLCRNLRSSGDHCLVIG